jgi:hypothetical protein
MENSINKPEGKTPVQFLVDGLAYLKSKAIEEQWSLSLHNKCVENLIKTALDIEKRERAYVWVEFNFNKIETRPKRYGKYLIERKDGKHHWETWNGSGWAYNHNEIRFYAEITSAQK